MHLLHHFTDLARCLYVEQYRGMIRWLGSQESLKALLQIWLSCSVRNILASTYLCTHRSAHTFVTDERHWNMEVRIEKVPGIGPLRSTSSFIKTLNCTNALLVNSALCGCGATVPAQILSILTFTGVEVAVVKSRDTLLKSHFIILNDETSHKSFVVRFCKKNGLGKETSKFNRSATNSISALKESPLECG